MRQSIAVWILILSISCNIWLLISSFPPAVDQTPVNQANKNKTASKNGDNKPSNKVVVISKAYAVFRIYRDDINALATVVVAIFTMVLGIFTISLARSTRVAALASKNSADVAIKVELPIIEIAQLKLLNVGHPNSTTGAEVTGGLEIPEHCGVVVNYRNSGRSHAEPLEQCAELRVFKTLPNNPPYERITHFSHGTFVKTDQTTGSLIGNNFTLTEDQRIGIADGSVFLWVYCYLKYKDFLSQPHEKRYCARWLGVHPHFGGAMGFVYDPQTPEIYLASY